jgi:hypothetical protein
MTTKPTAEVCQVWLKSDGRVIKAMRLGKRLEDYVGMKFADVTAQLVEEGWYETGRWSVASAADETLVTFQREKSS